MNETGRPQELPMSNPRADRVRDVAKLAGRPARLKRGRFLAEGPQAVREALVLHRERTAAGEPGVVHEVFASESCMGCHSSAGLYITPTKTSGQLEGDFSWLFAQKAKLAK